MLGFAAGAAGRDRYLAGTPLDRLADLPGVLVRVPAGTRAVDRPLLAPYDVTGRAVLLHTGWSAHFGTDRYGAPEAPHLTGDGARALVEAGAALVGIDSVNIDDMSPAARGERPAHSALLAAGVPVVEHLTGLDALPPEGFRFTAPHPPAYPGRSVPPRVKVHSSYAMWRYPRRPNTAMSRNWSGCCGFAAHARQ